MSIFNRQRIDMNEQSMLDKLCTSDGCIYAVLSIVVAYMLFVAYVLTSPPKIL